MQEVFKAFFNDLLYQKRYLFFRKYFAVIFAAISFYLSLLMFSGYYSYKTKNYKVFSGMVLSTQIVHKETTTFLNINLEGFHRNFQTFGLSKADAEHLDSELKGRKKVAMETNILDLPFGMKRKISSIKVSDNLIHSYKPDLRNNIYMGIWSFIFGCCGLERENDRPVN